MEHQAHPPPLGHCPRDVINLKNAPTLGHSQAPPLGHSQAPPPPWLDIPRVTSSTYSKGGTKIAEGWNKIAKGWNKIAEGWNKIAKGWNKIAEGWNKIAKGWNKIAKGWNKIFGMGNWGGRTTPPPPPPPPPGYGPELQHYFLTCYKPYSASTIQHRHKYYAVAVRGEGPEVWTPFWSTIWAFKHWTQSWTPFAPLLHGNLINWTPFQKAFTRP